MSSATLHWKKRQDRALQGGSADESDRNIDAATSRQCVTTTTLRDVVCCKRSHCLQRLLPSWPRYHVSRKRHTFITVSWSIVTNHPVQNFRCALGCWHEKQAVAVKRICYPRGQVRNDGFDLCEPFVNRRWWGATSWKYPKTRCTGGFL